MILIVIFVLNIFYIFIVDSLRAIVADLLFNMFIIIIVDLL